MKKLPLILLSTFLLIGCSKEDSNNKTIFQQEEKISILNSEISELENTKLSPESSVIEEKERLDLVEYFVTIKIKQSHVSLDIGKHLKDEMNSIEIQVPVSEEFYNQVNIGDILNNDFRAGSFLTSGSYGKWDISIVNKEKK